MLLSGGRDKVKRAKVDEDAAATRAALKAQATEKLAAANSELAHSQKLQAHNDIMEMGFFFFFFLLKKIFY